MKARIYCAVFGLLLGWCLTARSLAETPSSAFDAANQLYEQGRFAEAAIAYEKMLQSGVVSPALYFNLGNAYFKSNQRGRALVAYLQTERMAPRDPELRANLQFVRHQVPSPTSPPGRWQRWLGTLTLNEWTWLTCGALWLWISLLIAQQWHPAWKSALRAYVICGGIVAGFLGLCLGVVFQMSQASQTAVLIEREATVRNGPLDESPSAFTLHDGAELIVLDEKDNWLQITVGTKRIGWVRRDAVQLVPRW